MAYSCELTVSPCVAGSYPYVGLVYIIANQDIASYGAPPSIPACPSPC